MPFIPKLPRRWREEDVRRIQADHYVRTGRLLERAEAERRLAERERALDQREEFPEGPEWRVDR